MLWDENAINTAGNQITWSVSLHHTLQTLSSFIPSSKLKDTDSVVPGWSIVSLLCPSFGGLGSTEVRGKLQQVSCTVGAGDAWAS